MMVKKKNQVIVKIRKKLKIEKEEEKKVVLVINTKATGIKRGIETKRKAEIKKETETKKEQEKETEQATNIALVKIKKIEEIKIQNMIKTREVIERLHLGKIDIAVMTEREKIKTGKNITVTEILLARATTRETVIDVQVTVNLIGLEVVAAAVDMIGIKTKEDLVLMNPKR